MSALLAALLLAAAPPQPAQKAKELTARKAWEELYLAFASGEASGVPEAQRGAVSGALLKGCEALLQEDTVMAYSLGERAVVYEESAGALRCLARAARKTDQRAAAEAALRKGLGRFPKDGGFGLELGRLLLEEQDAAGAAAVLEKVPPRSREGAEAKRLLQQARAQTSQEGAARREAALIEQKMNGKGPLPRTSAQAVPAVDNEDGLLEDNTRTRTASLTYESGTGPDGMRTRSNGRFSIRYFNNNRDFGQRAEYEGQITAALDEAYDFTQRTLGETRKQPLDVVLYTFQEFSTHIGKSMARSVAGLYMDDAIRINDAAELTQHTRATLVHEYIHAVLDDLVGGGNARFIPTWLNEGLAEYVEWRYLGGDEPPRQVRDALVAAAKANKLPRLAALSQGPLLATGNASMAYGTSAVAVRELVRQGGMDRLLTLIREVGRGRPIQEALEYHYGKSLERLDEDLRSALR